MDAEWLRELQDRGRFFYERFPGAAAAEKWKQQRERAEREAAAEARQSRNPHHVEENGAARRSFSWGT